MLINFILFFQEDFWDQYNQIWGFLGGSVVKNPPANAGDSEDMGSTPGLEWSPEEGSGNPLQYSCLENLIDRGAWRDTVHGVTKESNTAEQLNNGQQ